MHGARYIDLKNKSIGNDFATNFILDRNNKKEVIHAFFEKCQKF